MLYFAALLSITAPHPLSLLAHQPLKRSSPQHPQTPSPQDGKDCLSVLRDNLDLNSQRDETPTEAAWWALIADASESWSPKAYMFNSKFAELCGLHNEELMARMANCELTLPGSQLNFLCSSIDRILWLLKETNKILARRLEVLTGDPAKASSIPIDVSYPTMTVYDVLVTNMTGNSRKKRKAVLVKHSFRTSIFAGRYSKAELWFEPVTPEEFDKAAKEHPEQCRDLLRSTGDLRSGQEILDGATAECKTTLSDLAKTAYGKSLLTSIENQVVQKSASLVDETMDIFNRLSLSAAKPEELVGDLDGAWHPDDDLATNSATL